MIFVRNPIQKMLFAANANMGNIVWSGSSSSGAYIEQIGPTEGDPPPGGPQCIRKMDTDINKKVTNNVAPDERMSDFQA